MGHPHYKRNAAEKKWVHVSGDDWDAPRLSRALLYAPVGTTKASRSKLENAVVAKERKPVTAQSLDADFGALLDHIQDRLFSGLSEAWLSKEGYDAWPDFEKLKDDAAIESDKDKKQKLEEAYKKALSEKAPDLVGTMEDPTERWARAIVELFVFTAYGGSAVNQGGTDRDYYKRFPDTHPIIVACQQLASFCIIARGVPWNHLSPPDEVKDGTQTKKLAKTEEATKNASIGCGCTAGTVNYFAFDDGYHEIFDRGTKYTNVKDLLDIKASGSIKKVTPGSVIVFNAGGKDYSKQNAPGGTTHIASVLRVSGARVQFFDTGVVVGSLEKAGAEGGTADHSFLYEPKGNISSSKDLVAIGVLSEKAPDVLGKQAELMAKSRPLGLVRLVLLDTENSKAPVRFVSKLLHMRFPVSYLIWSLRGLPVQGLSALWYVYGSSGGWTDVLAAGPPAGPASEMLKGPGELVILNVLRGHADGTVSVYRRKIAQQEDKKYTAENPGKPPRYVPVDGWYFNLNSSGGAMPPPPTPEMSMNVKLKLPDGSEMDLATWCKSKSTFGKRFVHRANDDRGTVNEENQGIFDS